MNKIIIKEDDKKIKGFCPECGAVIFIEDKFKKVEREVEETEEEKRKHYLLDLRGIRRKVEYDYIKADFVGEFNYCYKCGVDLETYPEKEK